MEGDADGQEVPALYPTPNPTLTLTATLTVTLTVTCFGGRRHGPM